MNNLRDQFAGRIWDRAIVGLVMITAILTCQVAKTEDGPASNAQQVAILANADILESSGLAASFNTPHAFWTHNDSGDRPRLFAFDETGRDLGVVTLEGISAIDWEDMASFRRDHRGWLLVADVGDNARRRKTCQLHLLPEPAFDERSVKVGTTIHFRYANGPRDCEAVGIDGSSNTVLLATKGAFQPELYALQLPPTPTERVLVARSIATISVPFATALDVSPNGRNAIVLTYGDAYEFRRRENESWAEAFRGPPQVIKMPARRQGESICYARDGRSLLLTSEKQPTPLWKVERKP